MKYPRPNHIDDYVVNLPKENKFLEEDFDDVTMPYIVKCTCGCEEFTISRSNHKTVKIDCKNCGKNITVYDKDFYTCSSKLNSDEVFVQYKSSDDDTLFNVCAIYVYSEDYPIEDDKFDSNDVTWCQVLGYGTISNKVFEIINDETA